MTEIGAFIHTRTEDTTPATNDEILTYDITASGTKRVQLTNLLGGLSSSPDGWVAIAGTFTYASATTINVSSGAAGVYSIGSKLRFQNNDSGTYLYAYVVGIADTLLTVVGNAVPNVTLTDAYYSLSSNPVGFIHWFSWTPTLSGGNSDLSGYDTAKFCIAGRVVHIVFAALNRSMSGSAGTSIFTLPVNSVVSQVFPFQCHTFYTGIPAAYPLTMTELTSGSSNCLLYKDQAGNNWAANETSIYIRLNGRYEI